jgi:hypothetical protein
VELILRTFLHCDIIYYGAKNRALIFRRRLPATRLLNLANKGAERHLLHSEYTSLYTVSYSGLKSDVLGVMYSKIYTKIV